MAKSRQFKNIENTGFAGNSRTEGSRLTNKDGSINLTKTGLPFYERISLYHTLLRMGTMRFLLSILLLYTTINLLFAGAYILVGVDKLVGGAADGAYQMNGFLQAFFFSSQTLTTVGYGHIAPVGLWANIIASIESFIGILTFALVTGLLYARFTRPQAYLRFSDNMLIAPYKSGQALMLRTATYKNNHLTEVEGTVTAALIQEVNGEPVRRFYTLPLEISRINSLALSWTLVHSINEESPLYGLDKEGIINADLEILVFIKAFDDHFSNTVQQRTSYIADELVYGAKFQPMFRRSPDGKSTLLELDKLNDHLPATFSFDTEEG